MRRQHPSNVDPALIEAHWSLVQAAHELSYYDDERAVPTGEVAGAIDLLVLHLEDEIEAWREPATLVML